MDQSPVVVVVQEFSASRLSASRSLPAKLSRLSSVEKSLLNWNELGRALSPRPSSSLPEIDMFSYLLPDERMRIY